MFMKELFNGKNEEEALRTHNNIYFVILLHVIDPHYAWTYVFGCACSYKFTFWTTSFIVSETVKIRPLKKTFKKLLKFVYFVSNPALVTQVYFVSNPVLFTQVYFVSNPVLVNQVYFAFSK